MSATIIDNIKFFSKSTGIPISTLEKQAGLSANIVYSWKTKKPQVDSLTKIAAVLNVSLSELLEPKEARS